MIADNATPASTLLLSANDLVELLGGGVSVRSIWRWVAEEKFPKPVHIGGRTLWRRQDVELFVGEANGSLKTFRRLKRTN